MDKDAMCFTTEMHIGDQSPARNTVTVEATAISVNILMGAVTGFHAHAACMLRQTQLFMLSLAM